MYTSIIYTTPTPITPTDHAGDVLGLAQRREDLVRLELGRVEPLRLGRLAGEHQGEAVVEPGPGGGGVAWWRFGWRYVRLRLIDRPTVYGSIGGTYG